MDGWLDGWLAGLLAGWPAGKKFIVVFSLLSFFRSGESLRLRGARPLHLPSCAKSGQQNIGQQKLY